MYQVQEKKIRLFRRTDKWRNVGKPTDRTTAGAVARLWSQTYMVETRVVKA